MPVVSVIIPVHNRESAVGDAIASVLAQDFTDFELILVDDASTDDTPEILKDWAARDARIRVVTKAANCGAAGARNAGVKAATGKSLAFLDSDDVWLPQKLSRQIGSGCSVCDALFEDGKGKRHARTLPEIDGDVIVRGKGLNVGSALFVDRALFDQIGPFDENLRRLEDWDWLLRAMIHGFLPTRIPHTGVVVRVGAPPNPEHVAQSAMAMIARHTDNLYAYSVEWAADFQAAAALEAAAAALWQGDWRGFVQLWVESFRQSPSVASRFITERGARVIKGDAPRFYRLFSKK